MWYFFGFQCVKLPGAMLNLTEAALFYEQEKIELTKNEFKILQVLMENKQKVVSRDTLMVKSHL